jgi:putative tryptophan/tyrosine transport system substrate-binding protein
VTTLAASAVPVRAEVQAPGKVARVGFLSSARRPTDAELQQSPWSLEMQRLGWVEGRNLVVERRFSDNNMDQLAAFARELVEARVGVIVTLGERDAAEARRLSSTLPIVLSYSGLDPVADGLIASFAKPGGNVTGVSRMLGETRAKRLKLIKTMLPTAGRVGVLFSPSPDAGQHAKFEASLREYAVAGGLLSYGPDWSTLLRQLAQQVDRILRGARPGELPMEQPSRFELVFNLATAMAIGLAVPQTLLLRADEVIS